MKFIVTFLLISIGANLSVTLLLDEDEPGSGSAAADSATSSERFEIIKINSPDATVLMFTSKWDEIVQGNLAPGKKVRIVYDPDRFPSHKKLKWRKAWAIFAEVKYAENGPVHSTELEGHDKNTNMTTTTLTIPAKATTFIIWLKYWDKITGNAYDSNFGKNYEFSFNQIVFTNTWDEYVNGKLYPGGRFDVLYDKRRLPWNDRGYLGMGRAWNIFAFVKFSDQGLVVKKKLEGPVGEDLTMNTRFKVPADATKVILWFYYTGYIHTSRYDSNQGANYYFTLK